MEILKVRIWHKRSVPPRMLYWGKDFFHLTCKIFEKEGFPDIVDIRAENSPGNKYFSLTPHDFIIMVSTGLKDKNEEEIWQGDVLLHEDGKIKEIVEWKKDMWTEEGFMTGFGEWFGTANQYERIGNIHENPELIKKETT